MTQLFCQVMTLSLCQYFISFFSSTKGLVKVFRKVISITKSMRLMLYSVVQFKDSRENMGFEKKQFSDEPQKKRSCYFFLFLNYINCHNLAEQLSQYLFFIFISFSLVSQLVSQLLGCMRYQLGLGLVLCISSSVNLTRTPLSSLC